MLQHQVLWKWSEKTGLQWTLINSDFHIWFRKWRRRGLVQPLLALNLFRTECRHRPHSSRWIQQGIRGQTQTVQNLERQQPLVPDRDHALRRRGAEEEARDRGLLAVPSRRDQRQLDDARLRQLHHLAGRGGQTAAQHLHLQNRAHDQPRRRHQRQLALQPGRQGPQQVLEGPQQSAAPRGVLAAWHDPPVQQGAQGGADHGSTRALAQEEYIHVRQFDSGQLGHEGVSHVILADMSLVWLQVLFVQPE